MIDIEWLTCTTRPADMHGWVVHKTSGRKLRLLYAAACRLVLNHAPDPLTQAMVEVMERHADGQVDGDEYPAVLEKWGAAYAEAIRERNWIPDTALVIHHAIAAAVSDPFTTGGQAIQWVLEAPALAARRGEVRAARTRIRQQVCGLFREIIGNPFRPWKVIPDSYGGGGLIQPDGKTVRLTNTARQLAEGIRVDQAFDRLPILADALEEAGVTDREILTHCRREGGHVRGCWALDVVLGKT